MTKSKLSLNSTATFTRKIYLAHRSHPHLTPRFHLSQRAEDSVHQWREVANVSFPWGNSLTGCVWQARNWCANRSFAVFVYTLPYVPLTISHSCQVLKMVVSQFGTTEIDLNPFAFKTMAPLGFCKVQCEHVHCNTLCHAPRFTGRSPCLCTAHQSPCDHIPGVRYPMSNG